MIGIALAHADITRHDVRGRRHHQPARDRRGVGPAHRHARSTTPSCGRTPAPRTSWTAWPPTAASTASRTSPVCRSPPTSPPPRSRGSSTTWTAPARAAEPGDLLFGTMDTWLLWNLTGGPDGGVHATDVTNASRTLLMDLRTLEWSDDLLAAFDIPRAMMPEIRPSSASLRRRSSPRACCTTLPIARNPGRPAGRHLWAGRLRPGRVEEHVRHRKLPHRQHRRGAGVRRVTGSSARSRTRSRARRRATRSRARSPSPGSLVQWLRDSLGLLDSAAQIEALAASVEDSGGVVIVPAFSGLFAPYWRPDARGAILGLTRFAGRAPHRARRAGVGGVPVARGDRRRGRGHGSRHRRNSRSTAAWWSTICCCRFRPTCWAHPW